jgi:beta-glucuronidase
MNMIRRILIFGWLGITLLRCSLGEGAEVRVAQDLQGHWKLWVDDQPFFIQGVEYRPTTIGQSPDSGTLKDWAFSDVNHNGRIDGPYEAWADTNSDGVQNSNEPPVGDFKLMQEMGINTIRWYMNDVKNQKPNKTLLRDLYQTYGIRVAVGNKFGAYTIDSGASWQEGTDYRDPKQRARLLKSVQNMVLDHKDEPYLLLWMLGNENNFKFTNTNAEEYPSAWASLINEAARLIHRLDGHHPVAFVNGDTHFLSIYKQYTPDVDIFGVNAYRGAHGFGDLWEEVQEKYGKPVLMTEFGGSFAPGADEDNQALYHQGCWLDIAANRAGLGVGNSLGGFAFAWLDEWWKAGHPFQHAVLETQERQGKGMARWSQEYCGILSQGSGRNSPFERRIRKVYFLYQKHFKNAPTSSN